MRSGSLPLLSVLAPAQTRLLHALCPGPMTLAKKHHPGPMRVATGTPTVPSVTHRLVVHRDALQALLLTNLDQKSPNPPWVLASRAAVPAQWNTAPVIGPSWPDSGTPAGLTILDVLTQGDTTPRDLTWLSGQPPSASKHGAQVRYRP